MQGDLTMRAIRNYLVLFCFIVPLKDSGASDQENGAKLLARFEHPETVSSVLFWPEKELLVTGCWDDSIRFWNIRTGKVDREWKAGHQGVTALAFGGKGMLVSGGCDQAVRVWKELSGTKAKEFDTEKATNSLAFSVDGALLSSSFWKKCYFWDLSRDRVILKSERSLSSAVAFSPVGHTAAIGHTNGIVIVIQDPCAGLTGNALILDKSKKSKDGVISDEFAIWSLAFSPDGRTLASFGEISDLILWEVLTGKERRRLNTEESIGFSVAFAPTGNVLATGEGWSFHLKGFPGRERYTSTNSRKKIDCDCARLWDIRTGKPICRMQGHTEGVRCVAFSANGKLLATASDDKSVVVWDVTPITKAQNGNAMGAPLEDLQSVWMNLTGDNATVAFDTILALSASPKHTLPFLSSKLRPVPGVEKTTVEKILKDLDSDDFPARERASQELSRLGEGAEPALREKLSKNISAEARDRIEKLIEKWKGHNAPPEILGALRGIETLERIGSDDAARLLEDLAKGASWARQTQDAKASLERIKQRRKS